MAENDDIREGARMSRAARVNESQDMDRESAQGLLEHWTAILSILRKNPKMNRPLQFLIQRFLSGLTSQARTPREGTTPTTSETAPLPPAAPAAPAVRPAA